MGRQKRSPATFNSVSGIKGGPHVEGKKQKRKLEKQLEHAILTEKGKKRPPRPALCATRETLDDKIERVPHKKGV